MTKIEQLLAAEKPFLTDGGFETSLFFIHGFEAPEFAAIVLMDDPKAIAVANDYFDGFLKLAEASKTGFVLDTNTWRGAPKWAAALGQTEEEMLRLNADAVRFAHDIKARWEGRVGPILINGVVGPAGDGYAPDQLLTVHQAEEIHTPQMRVLKETGVDMISALTMTHISEAIGIVSAAIKLNLPTVISFTVETNGCLPTGETLSEAIDAVDSATDGAPLYYMVNCAHPDHFQEALMSREDWIWRIGGLRANASRLSHAELDVATELDEGDPAEFGEQHETLARLLPNLRVIGGCCGTDERHVRCISGHLHFALAS